MELFANLATGFAVALTLTNLFYAFLGVLPMLAFPTKAQALGYLAAFALGTVISMAGFSWAMGLAARHCAAKGLQLYRGLMITCGLAAMVVGCIWIVQTFSTAAGHAAG